MQTKNRDFLMQGLHLELNTDKTKIIPTNKGLDTAKLSWKLKGWIEYAR